MALKIFEANESLPPRPIVGIIYGEPGTGKTSISCTIEGRKALLIDAEKGAGRATGRKIQAAQLNSWEDFVGFTNSDIRQYKGGVIIIDTAKSLLDEFMAESIMRADPKSRKPQGGLSLQGYGNLKDLFGWLMRQFSTNDVDVIFNCHQIETKRGASDNTRYEPEMTGGSKGILIGKADFVAYVSSNNNNRFIQFDATDMTIGKNPGGVCVKTEIPDVTSKEFPNFMGNIINRIKAKLSEIQEGQIDAYSFIDTCRNTFKGAGNWGAICMDYTTMEWPEDLLHATRIQADKVFTDAATPLLTAKVNEEGFTPEAANLLKDVVLALPLPDGAKNTLKSVLFKAVTAKGYTFNTVTKNFENGKV